MITRKKIQWGSISLLLLFISSMNFHHIIFNPVDFQALNNNETEKLSVGSAMSSEYTPDFTGSGEECNVTLQQSLIDSSPISILNTSDPLNNTFYEPCPTVEDFPSSSTIMSVKDIYAPNKTIILEEGSAEDASDELATIVYFTSFSTKSSCLLVNASFALSISGTPIVTIYLYNSLWNSVYSRSEPDVYAGMLLNSGTPTATGWYEFDLLDTFLNSSETENNTWFLCPYRTGGAGTARWRFKYTGTGNSEAYSFDGTLSHLSRYYLCKVGLAPDISPPNQTLIVEDYTNNGYEAILNNEPCATSFTMETNGYIENISVNLQNTQAPNTKNFNILLYNSTWDSSNSLSVPDGHYSSGLATLATSSITSSGWVEVTGIDYYLDNSKTENNTWFIGLHEVGSSVLGWRYTHDSDILGDDDNETWSFLYDLLFDERWELVIEPMDGFTVDFHLTLDLKIIDNIPSKIGLKINDTSVTGYSDIYGAGHWISTNNYSNPSGYLSFTLTADWWDVSCTITYVKIVYKKTDARANSNFVVRSNQEVLWNVTDSEGLNYLDARINETVTINFTIPSSWNDINVFNATTNKTDDIFVRSLNNGYNEICVLNAGSGNWYLAASSANLLESIDSYIGSKAESTFNYSNIVHFNASFKETIFQNDGVLNLSIYSPALINDVLNFTMVKTVFGTGQEISLGDWDISDTVTQYGVFRVQISWYNKTAVGFLEVNLTIIGESDLILIEPPQNAIYNPDQQFNIIVYYEDAHLHRAIADATINFNIANQGWKLITVDNGTTGYYVIPVNCSELPFSGSNHVEITATREFYSTPIFEYLFEISESTTTTTSTTTQPDTSTSTTTTTTTITETGTFPGLFTVLTVFGTLVIFTRRRKKL